MSKPSLPKSLISSLLHFQTNGLKPLEDLSKWLASNDSLISPQKLQSVAEDCGLDGEAGERIVAHIQLVPDFFETRSEFLERAADQRGEEELSKSVVNLFADLAFNRKVQIAHKLSELSYVHPDILLESGVILDARPVFDRNKKGILTYSLLTFLRLKLTRYNEPELLTIHLDKSDIEKLKSQCEDALKKLEVTEKQLKAATGNPVYIPGDDKFGEL